MKKIILALLSGLSFTAIAQPTAGLIAHWDMDSSTNDVSGGGHNGHGNNLTPAIGMDGIMGHAWYFNGVNSSITMPYSSAFNVPGYTIAVKIKVMGFYTGPCHANPIFMRGHTNEPAGAYYLIFSDHAAGYGCTPGIDTNRESFAPNAGTISTPQLPGFSGFDVTPHIVENVWYRVVATFNDTVFKIYINNALMTTVPNLHPGMSIGSSMDSASIGFASYDAAGGYPYAFHGLMDDLLLYNRALSDSEVTHLYDTCGSITVQPVAMVVPAGGTATYSVHSSIATPAYQWQQNSGTGFTNLLNAGPYSGVTTATLTVTGVTTSMNSYVYRCILNAEGSCTDTSESALLTLSVHDLTEKQVISIYPNPARNTIAINASNNIESISIFNVLGQKMYSVTPNDESACIDIAQFPAGVYYITVNGASTTKFIKE